MVSVTPLFKGQTGRLTRRRLLAIVGLMSMGAGLAAACQAPSPAPSKPAEPAKPAAPPTQPGAAQTAPAAPAKDKPAAKEAAPKEPVAAPKAGARTLNHGLLGAMPTLDPHVAQSWDREMARQLHEPLVDLKKESLELEGVLAESWQISNEGRTYTFKLKKDIVFSDGSPFDANAVKANFDRIFALKKGPYGLIAGVSGVEVVDPSTVRLQLTEAFRPFLGGLRLVFMVSPNAIKEHAEGDDLAQKWLHRNSAGTGPYVVQNWAGTTGAPATFTKNEKFRDGWQGNHIETINLLAIQEPGTQRLMLERGDLDSAELISRDAITDLKRNPDIQVLEKPNLLYMYLMMHGQAGPTADPRVRKAISHAFDYEAYTQLMSDTVPRQISPVPPELLGPGYRPPPIPQNTYDIDRARALMKEAGVPDGTMFNYQFTSEEQRRIIGEVFQAGLQKLGMNAQLNQVTPAVLTQTPQGWGQSRNPAEAWNTMTLTTPPRLPDAWAYLWYMWHTKASGVGTGRNLLYYSNPQFDQLVDQAQQTVDDDKVYDLYRKANEILINDAPSVFLDTGYRFVIMRKNVNGFWFHPTDYRTYPWYEMSKG